MSQYPSDPPPLPVVPIPLQPMYSSLSVGARPGVIGFIGVTSIVMASFAILAGIMFGLMDAGLLMASSAAKTMVAMSPPTPPAIAGSLSAERLPGDGLGADDRQNVADGLQRIRPLSSQQLLQLDELLAEHGKAIVPMVSSLSAQQLAATVSSSRHISYADTAGSDEFVLGDGRLEISDDRAVFFPTDGQPPLRANAIQLPPNSFGVSPTGLQPPQIQSVIRTINQLNGATIKTAQLNALIRTFQAPGQQIVVHTTDGSDPAWQIDSVRTGADGSLSVSCHHGSTFSSVNCQPNGTIGQSSISTSGMGPGAMPRIDPLAGKTALALTGAQFLLAIFLLIAGILTLKNSPGGGKLHWIYLGLKIPIAIGSAAATVWMWSTLMRSITVTTGTAAAGRMMSSAMSMGIIPVAIGCLYPVALIFLLMSGSARRYYASRRAETGQGR